MPLYVADYLSATEHLDAALSGAYLHLLMHYWQKGKLPVEDRFLARIARMTDRQWAAARPTIKAFFTDDWRQERVENEIAKAKLKAEARASSGSRGGVAKSLKYKAATVANATAELQQTASSEGGEALPSSSGLGSKKELASLVPKTTRGTRLDPGWVPSADGSAFAADALGVERAHTEFLKFGDYWLAKPGAAGCKLDWEATWRNWVRSAAERSAPRGPRSVHTVDTYMDALKEIASEQRSDDPPNLDFNSNGRPQRRPGATFGHHRYSQKLRRPTRAGRRAPQGA